MQPMLITSSTTNRPENFDDKVPAPLPNMFKQGR